MTAMSSSTVIFLLSAAFPGTTTVIHLAAANDNGLALTPPLGWRNWYTYTSNINQSIMERSMRAMASRNRIDRDTGQNVSLCDLGYCDVGLDDAWQDCDSPESADGMHYHREDGSPIVDLRRFPDLRGMVDLAHSLNLTAGWYGNNCICADSCRTPLECEKQIEADVKALVDLGFDSWKLDGCGGENDLRLSDEYVRRLSPTKSILVENCHWGDPDIPYYKPDRTLPPSVGCPWNFYRTSGDLQYTYASVMSNLGSVEQYRAQNLSYPGCWAYPDILMLGIVRNGDVGEPVLNEAEARSNFGAWCIVSSPLILGHDVIDPVVTDLIWDIISNREAIAVNQAYAGDSGGVYYKSNEVVALHQYEVYNNAKRRGDGNGDGTIATPITLPLYQYLSKPLGAGIGTAVLLMNSGEATMKLYARFRDLPSVHCDARCSCVVRDIWAHRDLGRFADIFFVDVDRHDAAFLLIKKCTSYFFDEKKEGARRSVGKRSLSGSGKSSIA